MTSAKRTRKAIRMFTEDLTRMRDGDALSVTEAKNAEVDNHTRNCRKTNNKAFRASGNYNEKQNGVVESFPFLF